MTDSVLQRGSGTFLSSDGVTLTLYNVQSEVIKKSNNLIRVPFPMADSNEAIMADLLGASRDIVVEGFVERSDVPDLYKFVRDIVGLKTTDPATLINGDQSNTGNSQIGYAYAPVSANMTSTGVDVTEWIRVYVNDASATYVAGDPNKVKWSLTLYEGSSTNSF